MGGGGAVDVASIWHGRSLALNPYTQHSTLYTIHPKPSTVHNTPKTQHCTLNTLNPAYKLHPKPSLYTIRPKFNLAGLFCRQYRPQSITSPTP
jgi:hypothetical protein